MFQPKRLWQKLVWGRASAAEPKGDGRRQRAHERVDCTGRDLPLRIGHVQYRMHLKDLSCSGASGLTDAPVRVGQIVQLEIDKANRPLAEVRWVRRAWAGLAFEQLIAPELVREVQLRRPDTKYPAPGRKYVPRSGRKPG